MDIAVGIQDHKILISYIYHINQMVSDEISIFINLMDYTIVFDFLIIP